MYSRLVSPPKNKSFFLFGPRGTGKSTWLESNYPKEIYIDLLKDEIYTRLLAQPGRLADMIPPNFRGWCIIDEVQKVPQILNEVHRLIEKNKLKFILTGSSARSLRSKGVNLLAGRALTLNMYPLTCLELGEDFNLENALKFGTLPSVFNEEDPKKYLQSYVKNYIDQEVKLEGLTRNISNFYRFLEASSFSQGCPLNISSVARDCAVERKVVEDYFIILEDLLMACRVPVFSKRAKRDLVSRSKFYYFDSGVYSTIRPMGPLDSPEEAQGAQLETLLLQELKALNSYFDLGYEFYYWQTRSKVAVDFVLYGERGLKAFEIKRKRSVRKEDLVGLKTFASDYPEAETFLLYGGKEELYMENIKILPLKDSFKVLKDLIS